MQRLFSMFPEGGPGVALLLLRVSVVAFLIIVAANYDGAYYRLVLTAVFLISIFLLIGFLTPVLCVIGIVLLMGNLIINSQSSNVLCVIAIANTIALGLLGPGAYSLDSKFFGRHVTIFRPRNRNDLP